MTTKQLATPESIATHPVIELINSRLQNGADGNNQDSAKLALIIEGGGMRGVVGGGMVIGMQELGIKPEAFDLVVGSSAGTLTGAYYIAGQTESGTSIYFEDLIDRRWLDPRRIAKREPVVGLNYLINEVMVNAKPLAWSNVLESAARLHAVTTRLPDFSTETLANFSNPEQLRKAMMASAGIPILSGRPVEIDGVQYIDGAESESIPVRSAISLGATHILALLTRPAGKLKSSSSLAERKLLFPAANRMIRGLGDVQVAKPARYNEEVLAVTSRTTDPTADPPYIFGVQVPEGTAEIKQLEQDPEILIAGAQAGRIAIYTALS